MNAPGMKSLDLIRRTSYSNLWPNQTVIICKSNQKKYLKEMPYLNLKGSRNNVYKGMDSSDRSKIGFFTMAKYEINVKLGYFGCTNPKNIDGWIQPVYLFSREWV